MSKAGIRAADWLQRTVAGFLAVTTIYLAAKVIQGRAIVKEKITSEQAERIERMETDLKKWREEDEAKNAEKKD
jgi:hypothetical protein